jgi:hypothetical protein
VSAHTHLSWMKARANGPAHWFLGGKGFRHPTTNEYMGWFTHIMDEGAPVSKRPMGASTVRWTTLDPCPMLSDRD